MTDPSRKNSSSPSLGIEGLEAVYDALAVAIDQAGVEHRTLFLTKLALLNAQALGDVEQFKLQIDAALRDLEGQAPAGA